MTEIRIMKITLLNDNGMYYIEKLINGFWIIHKEINEEFNNLQVVLFNDETEAREYVKKLTKIKPIVKEIYRIKL